MPVTEALVAFAGRPAHAAPERMPALVRSLVDTVAVALPGLDEVLSVERWAATEPTQGRSTVWGRGATVAASRAALLNGTAAHALDYDDAVPAMPLHPSAVLWPAVLAAAEAHGATWADALAAVDVGNAVVRAITETLPSDDHYGRGWHTTSTVGRIAAVAALTRLLALDEGAARHALGIVASTAAGSRAAFGTTTKPLHAGLAAHDAVVAVGMALAGVDADPDQLDHPMGFLAQYGVGGPRPDFSARLEHWASTWPASWSLKQFPSCYGTHYAVDAALLVGPELGTAPDVTAITVRVHPGSLRPLLGRRPATGPEGRFSLEYTVASALHDGSLGLDSFTDTALHRPAVARMQGLVVVEADAAPADLPVVAGTPYAHVRVVLADGSEHARLVTTTHGDAADPLTDDELDAKARSCARAAGWSSDGASALIATLRGTEHGSAVDLSALRRTRQEGTS